MQLIEFLFLEMDCVIVQWGQKYRCNTTPSVWKFVDFKVLNDFKAGDERMNYMKTNHHRLAS